MAKYQYYNRNPKRVHTQDCVCRAISTATTLPYEAVYNLLEITADMYNCEKLCVCCYYNLLEDILCYPRKECDFNTTVGVLVSKYPKNTLIIRVDQHLTSSINGTLLDIWDCSEELVDCFWIVR